MTIRTTKTAINLREELASLRNQGGYSEQQFYFNSLVTNGAGEFTGSDGTSAFTKYSEWSNEYNSTLTIENNKGRLAPSGGFPAARLTVSDLTSGKVYTVSAEFQASSSGKDVDIETATVVSDTTLQNISHTFTASASSKILSFRYDNNAGYVDFDNISIFEVDANDDVIYSMPTGWNPKNVFEDGLLQREGSAHDYEVVYDGFTYKVKPTVAPSATTETTVIGVKA